jgi:hypothetical protein
MAILTADDESEEIEADRKLKRKRPVESDDEWEPRRRIYRKAFTKAAGGATRSFTPTTMPVPPQPLPNAAPVLKANARDKDVAPSSSEFICGKKWVALWVTINPDISHKSPLLWGNDTHFIHLRPLLIQAGWTTRELKSQPGSKTCIYRGPDRSVCTTKHHGHVARHMLKHLPLGVGYYFVCPVCKHAARRSDMSTRHKSACKGWTGSSEQLKAMTRTNVFLRRVKYASSLK